jgi:predicted ATP-grasp superfamily ATP-dependent carboligase
MPGVASGPIRKGGDGMFASGQSGPVACILGGINLVRALSRAEIRCAVAAPAGSRLAVSRFVAAAIDPGGPDPRGNACLEALLRYASGQAEPPILFYEEDPDLLFVSRHRERLGAAFRFVIANADKIDELVDKGRFQELAARRGLPVPDGRMLRPAEGTIPKDFDLAYPIVVKALTRGEAWSELGYAAKALRIDNAEALQQAWPDLARVGGAWLAQRMIEGPESAIESYHVYVDAQGNVAAEFTGRKVRTFPIEHGYSTALEITNMEDVAELGREVVRRIGLRGVAKLDLKRDSRGQLHLLEVNPRFNLWHNLGAVAGVNIPAIVYADLVGKPRPKAGKARSGARWCRLATDRLAARASGMPFGAWLAWALASDATSPALNDPKPLVRGAVAQVLGSRHRTKVDADSAPIVAVRRFHC